MRGSSLGQPAAAVDFCVSLFLAASGVVFALSLMPTEQLVPARVSRRRITSVDPIPRPPKV